MSTVFDIKRSQSYWRFVPSGEGKHNSAELIELPDAELERAWDRAFASRFLRYPEEECFLLQMAAEFKNKPILSIGSGMGFHEIHYQRHGARVTCCDIVGTNLEVIRRMCAIKGLEPIPTIFSTDSSRESFEGRYDVAFIYGSLMAMPAAEQRHLLSQVRKALQPDGQIVLMLYTWKFAESTCGWRSPDEFDPLVFAKASDPTTEGEHCPWSDWHDDAKLLDLAGPGMKITRRQFWQQGLFVWYALEFDGRSGDSESGVRTFFDPAGLTEGVKISKAPLEAFSPAAGSASMCEAGLLVETGMEPFGYAVVSPQYQVNFAKDVPNTLIADISLFNGGLSVGWLDVARGAFLNTATLTEPGRRKLILPLPADISDFQMIFSNHRTDGSGPSSFMVHKVELIKRWKA
jgi:SAM-dependent methyltransferase